MDCSGMISHALETGAVKCLGVVFVFCSWPVRRALVEEKCAGCLFNLLTILDSGRAGRLSKATCFLLQTCSAQGKARLLSQLLGAQLSYWLQQDNNNAISEAASVLFILLLNSHYYALSLSVFNML